MYPLRSGRWLVLGCCISVSGLFTAAGETYFIGPPKAGPDRQFERMANRLEPGDELVLRGGVYPQEGRLAIRCQGRSEAPILIRAAEGEVPVLARPADPRHHYRNNGLEVVDSEHLVIRGLHLLRGSSGIRFIRGKHITLEDCEVSHTGNNGITLNSGDTEHFVIRGNHIHHTGLLDAALGETEGEGMYIGCNRAHCIASHHLIESNHIHHLRATSAGGNDGIEIKYGSFGNVLRHNVIHDTTSGRRYPGIFVYGVRDPETEEPNVVESNLIWNCGEGIYAVADAVVRNNLVLGCDTGMASYPHQQVPQMRNLVLVHNTMVHQRGAGVRLRWQEAENMIFANNAIYNAGPAVDARGLKANRHRISQNAVSGPLEGLAPEGAGFLRGGDEADAFVGIPEPDDAGHFDAGLLRPGKTSALRGAADARYVPELDYLGNHRKEPADIGALEGE